MESRYEDNSGDGNTSTNEAGPKYEPAYTGIPTDILTSAPAETSEE